MIEAAARIARFLNKSTEVAAISFDQEFTRRTDLHRPRALRCIRALHLDQARDGALELEVPSPAI